MRRFSISQPLPDILAHAVTPSSRDLALSATCCSLVPLAVPPSPSLSSLDLEGVCFFFFFLCCVPIRGASVSFLLRAMVGSSLSYNLISGRVSLFSSGSRIRDPPSLCEASLDDRTEMPPFVRFPALPPPSIFRLRVIFSAIFFFAHGLGFCQQALKTSTTHARAPTSPFSSTLFWPPSAAFTVAREFLNFLKETACSPPAAVSLPS